jgi:2-phospho-L-lactate guanylyltransferase
MRTAAILPVKRFDRAKSRLGETVADELRGRLAQAMVADVLSALAHTTSIELTIVVSCEPSLLAQAAKKHGALLVPDSEERGQSAAVALGVERALDDGIERVLCIPGDCPALDPRELDALLDADASAGELTPRVAIVPDRHGSGTNGLLLAPPDAIAPSFGPDSCERHRALALAAGVHCRLERPASLLLDVDTGADLAALRDRLTDGDATAVRTHAVLSQHERQPIISIITND